MKATEDPRAWVRGGLVVGVAGNACPRIRSVNRREEYAVCAIVTSTRRKTQANDDDTAKKRGVPSKATAPSRAPYSTRPSVGPEPQDNAAKNKRHRRASERGGEKQVQDQEKGKEAQLSLAWSREAEVRSWLAWDWERGGISRREEAEI